ATYTLSLHDALPISVRDWNTQHVALLRGASERRICLLDADVNMRAHELDRTIAQHGAGNQTRFQENLKAVADAKDRSAASRERLDRKSTRLNSSHDQ